MTEAAYSFKDDGYSFHDFDIICPNSGQPCPARQNTVELYVGNVGQTGVEAEISLRDKAVLGLKLAEMTVAANIIRCPGTRDGECPTRASMNNSDARKAVVGRLRKIIHRGIK